MVESSRLNHPLEDTLPLLLGEHSTENILVQSKKKIKNQKPTNKTKKCPLDFVLPKLLKI